MELNINTATVNLVVTALNKCKFKRDAAKELGIGECTLYKWINKNNLKLVKGKWVKN